MNKRHLHYFWTRLRRVHYLYLIAACLVSGWVALMALRNNNLTALRLRDEVLQTDQKNGDTEAALKQLREYVYGHMNTDLASSTSVYPSIQLKYRYERLVEARKQQVDAANTKIYNEAQHYCEQLMPTGVSRDRVPCIQQYVDSHPAASLEPIPDSLYKFDFASPAWSPDLAGWNLLAFGFFGLLLVIRLVLEIWLKYELKRKL